MDFTEFNKCLKFIKGEGELEFIQTLTDPDFNFFEVLIEPFKDELNKNLLNIPSREGKTDIIKHYLFEFWETNSFYQKQADFILNGSIVNYLPNKFEHISLEGNKRKLSDYENFLVLRYNFTSWLIDEIQQACFKYNIYFFDLIEELNFEGFAFDVSFTFAFDLPKKQKELNKQQQESKQATEKQEKEQSPENHQATQFKKYKGAQYALAYVLTLFAKGMLIPESSETIKKTAFILCRNEISPGTFYNNVLKIKSMKELDLNKESKLSNFAGEDWKEAILEISDDTEALRAYLKEKRLL